LHCMSVFDPKQILALAPQISAPDLERTFTRAVKEKNSGLAQLPVSEGVVSPQDNYRTNDRNYHAVDIEARYSCGTQKTEQHSPDYCADNSERDVEHQALSLPVDNLAADESRDEESMIQLTMDMRVLPVTSDSSVQPVWAFGHSVLACSRRSAESGTNAR
jgi:hypothetical protein